MPNALYPVPIPILDRSARTHELDAVGVIIQAGDFAFAALVLEDQMPQTPSTFFMEIRVGQSQYSERSKPRNGWFLSGGVYVIAFVSDHICFH
jgi:hypothetical protein